MKRGRIEKSLGKVKRFVIRFLDGERMRGVNACCKVIVSTVTRRVASEWVIPRNPIACRIKSNNIEEQREKGVRFLPTPHTTHPCGSFPGFSVRSPIPSNTLVSIHLIGSFRQS